MATTRILRVLEAKVVGDHSLEIEFNDGIVKRVDLEPLLTGPVFEPLLDPRYFARVVVDPVCGTIAWPNGADLAPEALRGLDGEDGRRTQVAI